MTTQWTLPSRRRHRPVLSRQPRVGEESPRALAYAPRPSSTSRRGSPGPSIRSTGIHRGPHRLGLAGLRIDLALEGHATDDKLKHAADLGLAPLGLPIYHRHDRVPAFLAAEAEPAASVAAVQSNSRPGPPTMGATSAIVYGRPVTHGVHAATVNVLSRGRDQIRRVNPPRRPTPFVLGGDGLAFARRVGCGVLQPARVARANPRSCAIGASVPMRSPTAQR